MKPQLKQFIAHHNEALCITIKPKRAWVFAWGPILVVWA